MADQVVSPNEALIAKQKLEAMVPPPPPVLTAELLRKAKDDMWSAQGMYPGGIQWNPVRWPGDEREP
jgi:hypothetical protein